MTVPTVTVYWLRQAPQKYRPGRPPLIGLARSRTPQWGQTGPSGHWIASKCLRAASSFVKRVGILVTMAISKLDDFIFDLVARTATPQEGTQDGLRRAEMYREGLLDLQKKGLNGDPEIRRS